MGQAHGVLYGQADGQAVFIRDPLHKIQPHRADIAGDDLNAERRESEHRAVAPVGGQTDLGAPPIRHRLAQNGPGGGMERRRGILQKPAPAR